MTNLYCHERLERSLKCSDAHIAGYGLAHGKPNAENIAANWAGNKTEDGFLERVMDRT